MTGTRPVPVEHRPVPRRYQIVVMAGTLTGSDVNKDLSHKDQDQDQDLTVKDQDKDKDLSSKDQDQYQDLTLKDKDKDKDLSRTVNLIAICSLIVSHQCTAIQIHYKFTLKSLQCKLS